MSDKKENDVAELKELESAVNSSLDLKKSSTDYMSPLYADNLYESFSKILTFARKLNVQLAVPEFVFIGRKGQGKSTLIESILGYHIINVGESTKRPVIFTLQNNAECKEPKFTIRRDLTSSVSGTDRDVEVPLKLVSSMLKERQNEKDRSEENNQVPIRVVIESNQCINMTLIDTPALPEKASPKDKETEAEKLVYSFTKQTQRHVIFVEETSDWQNVGKLMFTFVKRIDPTLSRTTLVSSKFHLHLKTLNSTIKLNRFLASKPRDIDCYFVSLFSSGIRNGIKADNLGDYNEKVFQSYMKDKNIMNRLQFDKRFSRSIGIGSLKEVIQQKAWKMYQASIPKILKSLRQLKRDTQFKLSKLKELNSVLDSSKLRSIASNYVVQFLQIIEKLINGTSEGNPTVNGQTLSEEKDYGSGEWFDSNFQEIEVDAEKMKIPFYKSRLYGGQQFERLLSEFKIIVENTKIPQVTMDDVATSAGINKLNNVPNYVWAASDIGQQKARESLGTLIDQLCKRAVYTMKRLTVVSEKIMEARKKNKNSSSGSHQQQDDFQRYPYFIYHVKDLYNEFVDQTAERVKEKCLDEFYCTSTIYWDLTDLKNTGKDIPTDSNDPKVVKEAVVKLATKVFKDLKKRIARNVMLKFYNFFLIPMQTSLWTAIQSTVTSLTEEDLEEIFEVNAVKEKLAADEKELKTIHGNCDSEQKVFQSASTTFSHPTQKLGKSDSDNGQDKGSESSGAPKSLGGW